MAFLTDEQAIHWNRAVQTFNQELFYDAHEILEEDLWRPALNCEESDLAAFYQGVLQVGVGCYHLKRGNKKGALTLMKKGLFRLEALNCSSLFYDEMALKQWMTDTHIMISMLSNSQLNKTEIEAFLFPKLIEIKK